ncbi:MAG TPA: diphthine--ammonia ligase [Chitinolyticbacter sp.]|nr:diphthine--ammonia ligase [Chitinolyticbacter sp.]
MISSQPFLASWSGGKDACLAFHLALAAGHRPVALINMLNETGERSRSHGLSPALLNAQAAALGLPLLTGSATWAGYETEFVARLVEARDLHGATAAVFGDIDLQPHRDWEEMVCARAGLSPLLPLWQRNRRELVEEMVDSGIVARIVSCNATLGPDFLGRAIDRPLIAELEALGIDACGENGEYHTVVLDAPAFNAAIAVRQGARQRHGDYWFLDLSLA